MTAPRFDRFDYLVWAVLGGLAALIGLTVLWGDQVGARIVQTAPAASLSAFGRVSLTFAQPMNTRLTESRFSLTPAVKGQLRWNAERTELTFVPDRPFDRNTTYTARLNAGAPSDYGLTTKRDVAWSFTVRAPDIAFLAPTNGPREVWRVALAGGAPVQITQTNGQVFDYAVSPDGEYLVYSVMNEQRGSDLWVIRRDGTGARPLTVCGLDQCTAPDWSPDGLRVAYSREPAGLQPGAPNGPPRVWTVDVTTGQTAPVYQNNQVLGYGPVWSPDGQWLAAFDGGVGAVRVLNVRTSQDMLIETAMGTVGTFSPDGRAMIFNDMNFDGSNPPYIAIYQADLEARAIVPVIGREPNAADYSVPAWSPLGDMIAVALRDETSGPSKQLWVMSPAGEAPRRLTDTVGYTYGGYRWNPWGTALVAQRLALGVPFATPELVLMEVANGQITSLVSDGALPRWLP